MDEYVSHARDLAPEPDGAHALEPARVRFARNYLNYGRPRSKISSACSSRTFVVLHETG